MLANFKSLSSLAKLRRAIFPENPTKINPIRITLKAIVIYNLSNWLFFDHFNLGLWPVNTPTFVN